MHIHRNRDWYADPGRTTESNVLAITLAENQIKTTNTITVKRRIIRFLYVAVMLHWKNLRVGEKKWLLRLARSPRGNGIVGSLPQLPPIGIHVTWNDASFFYSLRSFFRSGILNNVVLTK